MSELGPNDQVRCPSCGKNKTLWRSIMISGWEAIDERLEATGEREADWNYVEPGDIVGCGECSWTSRNQDDLIVTLGTDGRPLPFIHAGQLEIDAA